MKIKIILALFAASIVLTACAQKAEPPMSDNTAQPTSKAPTEIRPQYAKDSRTGLCFAWVSNSRSTSHNYSFAIATVPCDKVEQFLTPNTTPAPSK